MADQKFKAMRRWSGGVEEDGADEAEVWSLGMMRVEQYGWRSFRVVVLG
jgi:hypothetical protein